MQRMTLAEVLAALTARLVKLIAMKASTPPSQYAKLSNEFGRLLDDYRKLVNDFPDNPAVLFGAGLAFRYMDQPGMAVAMFHRSVQEGALGAAAWLNLGASYKLIHADEKAKEAYREAMKQAQEYPVLDESGANKDLAAAYHGMASLFVNANRSNEVIYWTDKALKIRPNDRFAKWNRGLALLEMGEWEEGFRLYHETGFIADDEKPMERKLKTYGGLPFWDGTPGKTVICYGEQGVGDEIMYSTILPDLMRDCRVIVDCDPRLERIFRRAFPEAEAVYPTSEITAPYDWIASHKVDAQIPMGSLGMFYRKKAADFPKVPVLSADPEIAARWRGILEPWRGLRIGISWRGGLPSTRQDKRSIPLIEWKDILTIPGVHFFSLQYQNEAADEAAHVGNELSVPIHHWGDMIASYDETAGFLANIDAVITVNTSLHHLAGALGTRQYCLTPVMCAWRYQNRGPSPWYGNCEMLRQSNDDEWSPVLKRAASRVKDMLSVRAAA